MAETTPGGNGRWLRIGLIVSLALNLLIVGALIGAAFSGGRWHHDGPPRAEAVGGPLTRALSPEDRRAIARAIHAAHRRGDLPRGWRPEEFAGVLQVLRAEPFDPAALEARLETLNGQVGERLKFGQSLLVRHVAGMDAEERAAYAVRLETVLRQDH